MAVTLTLVFWALILSVIVILAWKAKKIIMKNDCLYILFNPLELLLIIMFSFWISTQLALASIGEIDLANLLSLGTPPQTESNPTPTPNVCDNTPNSLRTILKKDDFDTALRLPRKFDETFTNVPIRSQICQICLCNSNLDDQEYEICNTYTYYPRREDVRKCTL